MKLQSVIDHGYIFLSLFLGVYSQLIMRWRVSLAGSLPESLPEKAGFIVSLLLSPWVISGLAATFLGGVVWMMAMTKFEISYAYPWMALNYVFVLIFSNMFLGEALSGAKILGSIFVMIGIIIISRGS